MFTMQAPCLYSGTSILYTTMEWNCRNCENKCMYWLKNGVYELMAFSVCVLILQYIHIPKTCQNLDLHYSYETNLTALAVVNSLLQ